MRGFDVEVDRHTSAAVRACRQELFLVGGSVGWSSAGAGALRPAI